MRDWYADAAKSRTLLLKSDCTATKRIAAQFAIGSEVYFTVTYRNDYGIENYYTYQTQSAGRAGTGYLSDHMQQLAFVTPVVSSASDVMPLSLSLVYNSAQQGGYFGQRRQLHPRLPEHEARQRLEALGAAVRAVRAPCGRRQPDALLGLYRRRRHAALFLMRTRPTCSRTRTASA